MVDNLLIDTPENVLLDAEIAGFGTRCLAALVDYLILFILLFIIDYLFAPAYRRINQGTWAVAIFTLVQFVIASFYHLLFELFWSGQTPGKRLLGIRVIQASGMPLTIGGAIIRNLLRLFDFLPLFYVVGMLSLFATRRTQRLGDLAANTVVIRERRQVVLENLQEDFSVHYVFVPRTAPIPSYILIDALDENDRRDVVDYLRRRATLRGRENLSGLLAQRIAARLGVNGVAGDLQTLESSEVFLEQVARAFEQADELRRTTPTALP